MKLPNWLRPRDAVSLKYWLHLLIIVLIVYFLINQFIQPMEITITNVLQGVVLVGVADILSHSILQID